VDDHTYTHTSEWPEWSTGSIDTNPAVTVISNTMRKGMSAAKAAGASILLPDVDILVFLDVDCVVQDNWLQPLLHTLDKYPHAVVYPGVDSLVISNDGSSSITRSANVVSGFDWGLGFKWETVNDGTSRLGYDHTEVYININCAIVYIIQIYPL
jgi:GT2 family glycosyltransferase